jgi:hypothetical protein
MEVATGGRSVEIQTPGGLLVQGVLPGLVLAFKFYADGRAEELHAERLLTYPLWMAVGSGFISIWPTSVPANGSPRPPRCLRRLATSSLRSTTTSSSMRRLTASTASSPTWSGISIAR